MQPGPDPKLPPFGLRAEAKGGQRPLGFHLSLAGQQQGQFGHPSGVRAGVGTLGIDRAD